MLGALPFTSVMAAKGDLSNVASGELKVKKPLKITLGKAELIDVGSELADVLVADPSLIDVMAVQSDRLYIVGKNIGDTNIITLDGEGNIVKRLDIHVTYDLQAIQSTVDELFPDEDVKIGSVHDQIILTGTASSALVASKVQDIVTAYVGDLQDEEGTADQLIANLLETRGDQQVMLQVKIVEATRDVIRELGISTDVNDPNELAATTLFGASQASSLLDGANSLGIDSFSGGVQDPLLTARLVADTGLNGIGQLGLFLRALEQESLVNILAEPNLTAVSGEQAGFLASTHRYDC